MNRGPDPAGSPAGSFRVLVSGDPLGYSLDYGRFILYSVPPGSPCGVNGDVPSPPIGGTLKVFYTVSFDELLPGESASCDVDFTINPFAAAIDPAEVADDVVVQSWRVRAILGSDPDFGDNEATITFLLAPQIPTLDRVGLGLFALGLVVASLVVRSRRKA